MPQTYTPQPNIRRFSPPIAMPWRRSRTSQAIQGLIPITLIIVVLELSTIFGYNFYEFNAVGFVTVLLIAVFFTASRFGPLSGVAGSLVASLYLAYNFSPPGQLFQFSPSMRTSLPIISLLYIGIAVVAGYMRLRIEQLLFDEQYARLWAEEQQYRVETILDQLPIGVFINDARDDQTIFSNQHSQQLLKKAQSVEISGRFPGTQDDLLSIIKEQSNLDGCDQEIILSLHNGSHILLNANTTPVTDLNGQTVATVTTFIDITHRKEIEQRKDDFISIASHELKTPVTSLKIYLQLLARHQDLNQNQQIQTIVGKANNQVNKLANLMNDLLDVRRIQTGKSDYRFKRFSLNNLAREVVTSIKSSTKHKIHLKGKVADQVWADPEKIRQVITNLLNNAIKYSPNSQDINVILRQEEHRVVVAIQDFGIGIETAEQSKIFTRFYQVEPDSNNASAGLGIGLFLCQKIVQDHGGEIWVDSQKDRGSTFSFSLPLQPPHR